MGGDVHERHRQPDGHLPEWMRPQCSILHVLESHPLPRHPAHADDPHTKAGLLLQAGLEGVAMPISDYNADKRVVLDTAARLLQVGWLSGQPIPGSGLYSTPLPQPDVCMASQYCAGHGGAAESARGPSAGRHAFLRPPRPVPG